MLRSQLRLLLYTRLRAWDSPYFPLSLLDQPHFHPLVVKGISELCCDRHSTRIRTHVWSIAQNSCGWLWCQRRDVTQI